MIVADTNVLLYLVLPSDLTAAAEALYANDQQWSAPVLWRSEFCNTLALYLRKQELTIDQAIELQSAAEDIMAENEYQVDSADVLRLVSTSGQTAYDCEFVALAKRLGAPLFTADKKLLRAFPSIAVPLASTTL